METITLTAREIYRRAYHNCRVPTHPSRRQSLYESSTPLPESEYGRRATIQYNARLSHKQRQPDLVAPVTWNGGHNLELNGAIDKNGMITRTYKGYMIVGKVYWADFHRDVPDDFWWVAEIYYPDGTFMTWIQSPAGIAASMIGAAKTVSLYLSSFELVEAVQSDF